MLLGIPEADQQPSAITATPTLRTEAGEKMQSEHRQLDIATGEMFAAYIDWRVEHPSDDIMTELLNAEFEDETGATRRLPRDELLHLPQGDRQRGQRNHHPADRLGRQGAGRPSRTSGAMLVDEPRR